jgi:opacity protein-like surface antigen
MRKIFLAVILFAGCGLSSLFAQAIEIGESGQGEIRRRLWDVYGTIHTNGFGVGCQFGREHNIHYCSGFDVEYAYYRHFKEQRLRYDRATLVYGKLNYFGMLRGGYGFTRILNAKPYWGGVEVGYFLYGGVSLGLSVPVYLYISSYSGGNDTKRYDPEEHKIGNINGRASFWKGFKEIKPHPGLYLKTGLSFDFAKNDARIIKLDIGAASDFYLIPVEKMAFSPKQYILFTGYLTFHFGKRRTDYE